MAANESRRPLQSLPLPSLSSGSRTRRVSTASMRSLREEVGCPRSCRATAMLAAPPLSTLYTMLHTAVDTWPQGTSMRSPKSNCQLLLVAERPGA